MDSLLDDWKWKEQEPVKPILITALGDVFVQGYSGKIYFLDAVTGMISEIANDQSSFQLLLKDTECVTNKMFPSTIIDMRKNGLISSENEVYFHKKPLVLGGEDIVSNYEVTDIEVHISLMGQIHRQVSELPPMCRNR